MNDESPLKNAFGDNYKGVRTTKPDSPHRKNGESFPSIILTMFLIVPPIRDSFYSKQFDKIESKKIR